MDHNGGFQMSAACPCNTKHPFSHVHSATRCQHVSTCAEAARCMTAAVPKASPDRQQCSASLLTAEGCWISQTSVMLAKLTPSPHATSLKLLISDAGQGGVRKDAAAKRAARRRKQSSSTR